MDPASTATAIVAALRGGYVLARAADTAEDGPQVNFPGWLSAIAAEVAGAEQASRPDNHEPAVSPAAV